MLRTTLAGLRARMTRMLLSAVSIVLGVAFVACTFTFTATVRAAFFDTFAAQARNVDAAVEPPAGADVRKRDGGGRPALPLSVSGAVAAVPGVAAVEGRLSGQAPVLGRDGRLLDSGQSPGTAVDMPGDARFLDFTLSSGSLPQAPDEALLDKDSAARGGFTTGSTVTVLDPNLGRHTLRLTGIIDLGIDKQLRSGPAILALPGTVEEITGVKGYDRIDVAAAPGVSQAVLARRIRAAVTTGTVVTGTQLAHDLADSVLHQVDLFLTGLLVFGVVALLVAALVIYNTFKILVAQRNRELALLRCVGATRRQVFTGVVTESVVTGLAASLIGVVAGTLLAAGVRPLLNLAGAGIPSGRLVISPTGVLLALGIGLIVTVAAAVLPAVLATRVPPVSALRTQPEGRIGSVRLRAARLAAALLFAAAGIAITAEAIPQGRNGLLLVVAGGCVFFLGVLAAGPLIVGALAAPFGRLPGVPLRLAVSGARRNPGRTATTMAALTVGVGLMTLFSVVLATAGTFAGQQLTQHYPFDYMVDSAADTGAGIPSSVAGALRADPHIAVAAELRVTRADGLRIAALDPTAYQSGVYKPPLAAGSIANGIPDGSVALYDKTARSLHALVGGTITLALPHGSRKLRVSAIYTQNLLRDEQAVLSWADFTRGFGPGPDTSVLVLAKQGVPATDSRAAIDQGTQGQPLLRVNSTAAYKGRLNSAINQMTALLGALLATAIVIALFGIANTLSLSVLERTRESALLRALGLTRRQLRRSLTAEALLIGLMGGMVGLAIGCGFGWAISQAFLHDSGGGTVVFPAGRILIYLVLAGLAGVVAALVPARRAARIPIIEGMSEA